MMNVGLSYFNQSHKIAFGGTKKLLRVSKVGSSDELKKEKTSLQEDENLLNEIINYKPSENLSIMKTSDKKTIQMLSLTDDSDTENPIDFHIELPYKEDLSDIKDVLNVTCSRPVGKVGNTIKDELCELTEINKKDLANSELHQKAIIAAKHILNLAKSDKVTYMDFYS